MYPLLQQSWHSLARQGSHPSHCGKEGAMPKSGGEAAEGTPHKRARKSSAAASPASSGGLATPGSASSVILCLRCNEPTAMMESQPAGKNPLRRHCNWCEATYRSTQRVDAKTKKILKDLEGASEKPDEERPKLIKDELKGKSEEGKQTWYQEQKRRG